MDSRLAIKFVSLSMCRATRSSRSKKRNRKKEALGMRSLHNNAILLLPLIFASGCATVRLNAGFPEVSALIEERSGFKVAWNNGTALDREAAEKLEGLLKKKLNADDAVQIGLLNNRELQAVYSDLGVAEAALVQAGLLNNPVFDAAIKWPTAGGSKPDLDLA